MPTAYSASPGKRLWTWARSSKLGCDGSNESVCAARIAAGSPTTSVVVGSILLLVPEADPEILLDLPLPSLSLDACLLRAARGLAAPAATAAAAAAAAAATDDVPAALAAARKASSEELVVLPLTWLTSDLLGEGLLLLSS